MGVQLLLLSYAVLWLSRCVICGVCLYAAKSRSMCCFGRHACCGCWACARACLL